MNKVKRMPITSVSMSSNHGRDRAMWVGRVLMATLTVLLVALLARVVQLQAAPPETISELLNSQQSASALMGRRGALLDREGRPLASTRVSKRLFVDPALIVDRGIFSERVAYNLDYDPVAIEKAVAARSRSRYVVIDQRLDEARLAKLDSLDLPGLATEAILVRDYPQGRLAGQLVGFVGRDGDGLEGLERQFDDRLKSQTGRLAYLRDAKRKPLWVESEGYRPQADGQTIRLSIDLSIQAMAQQQLEAAVEKFRAAAGQMIVMDPRTGEVLAMANYPTFDPAKFSELPAEQRRNRAVTDVFEPGSIFKPFVWAALTETGVMRPGQKVDCTLEGVWRTPYGRRLRDAHPEGLITWDEVLVQSSNIGMAKAAEKITPEQLHTIVRAFGFGVPTGSGLPGESPGLLNPLAQWTRYSQSSIPMGQEIGVTGMQIVRAFCTIANDGYLITPTIEAVDYNAEQALIQERLLSPSIAMHTRTVLGRTVEEGTGRHAKSKLYDLFGKTGTAQLPDAVNGGYHQDRYVSSFLGGAPLDKPRLVIGCFIQDPDRSIGHYGGLVAAPAVKEVLEQSLLYLGVPPKAVEEESD